MRRRAPAAAAFALAALLLAGRLASADPADPTGAAATQVGQAGAAQGDSTGADQLSGHARTAAVAGVVQVGGAHGHPTTPAQITRPAAGRNTQVGVVVGHDRCDAASPEAARADCAHIPENQAGDFQGPPTDATPDTVDPNAPSQDLVNGILSSGTGTVVQLPPK